MAIVACECLTGSCPFSGRTVGDLTIQICTERPTPPSELGEVPRGFDAWFFKATGKNPGQRFKSIAAMEGALTPILAAAEARASRERRSRAWLSRPQLSGAWPSWARLDGARSWSRPELPAWLTLAQLRSASRSVRGAALSRLSSRWSQLRARIRDTIVLWSQLLPEERRRIALLAMLSLFGLTLLVVSSSRSSHSAADPYVIPPASAAQPANAGAVPPAATGNLRAAPSAVSEP
jgi:hypothetical protein